VHCTVDSAARPRNVFPQDVAPAQLLFVFVKWFRGRPWGAVGTFDLAVEHTHRQFPADADVGELFAIEIHMPDADRAGFSLIDARAVGRAPKL
jgi:hypothetical protein